MKLDTYPQGYDFPGTTNYDDGRLPALPAVVLSAFSFLTNDFSVIRFEHDFIFWEDLQITDGINTLIKGTDYTMGDKDKCLSDDITEILGTTKTVVNGVIINNIAYHGITLTASGKYVGDSISAREYNENYRGTRIPVTSGGYTITETGISKLTLDVTRSSALQTITLPDATTNDGQIIIIDVSGSGVGNVGLAGTGAQTINGLAIASWVFNGIGKLKITSDGANYKTDADYIWDTYINPSDTKQEVSEYTNGKIEINGWDFKLGTGTATMYNAIPLPFLPNFAKTTKVQINFSGYNTDLPINAHYISVNSPTWGTNIIAYLRVTPDFFWYAHAAVSGGFKTNYYYIFHYSCQFYKA